MAGRPSANAAHEKRLNLPRLRGETRRRTASSAPPSGRSLADGWCHPGASTTHIGSTVPRFYSSDDPPWCRVRATHRETVIPSDLLAPRSLRLARKIRRRQPTFTIATPASDSVTNRRELQFSNQILKTKQDDGSTCGKTAEATHQPMHAQRPPGLSSMGVGSKCWCPVVAEKHQCFA